MATDGDVIAAIALSSDSLVLMRALMPVCADVWACHAHECQTMGKDRQSPAQPSLGCLIPGTFKIAG